MNEQQLKDLLERLVWELNDYNKPDMLNGYLNSLAGEFNEELKRFDLPTISEYGEEE